MLKYNSLSKLLGYCENSQDGPLIITTLNAIHASSKVLYPNCNITTKTKKFIFLFLPILNLILIYIFRNSRVIKTKMVPKKAIKSNQKLFKQIKNHYL